MTGIGISMVALLGIGFVAVIIVAVALFTLKR